MGQDPRSDLTRNASALKSEWPLAVVQFYLGRGSPQEVFLSAKDPNPLRNMYQLCEAYFYLGEDALIRGRLAEARDLFQKTIATGITSFFEYHAAAVELNRMKTQ
jgi:lipoprotein NlpI